MQNTLNLDTLLEHIRLHGIPVGTLELQRLQAVFAAAPALPHPELRELFCTLLAKDDNQRRTIQRLFEQLIPFEADEAGESPTAWQTSTKTSLAGTSLADDPIDNQPVKKRRKPLNVWYIGLAILSLVLLPLLLLTLHESKEAQEDNPSLSK